ncbi:hypothetical protein GGF41_000513 [Coemansia sp. RSA 2531]|nr:hypothetical protein GGF41_000513 [Coemansia sp. RSA 2531]
MFSSTPFQFLPPHLVRLIVDHVVGSSRQVFAGFEPNSNEWNRLLKPLLWTCRNFRAAAYPLYCSRYRLFIANSQTFRDFLESKVRASVTISRHTNINLGYPTHHLAKTLDIEVDEKSIYSGEALNMLSRAPYDGCAFPLVRRIVFIIVMDNGLKEDNRVKRNTVAFIQRIRQMAPNVDDICIRPANYDYSRYDSIPIYNILATQLFQLARRIQHDGIDEALIRVEPTLELDGIYNLVHIKYATGKSNHSFIRLARLNSTTLESLIIECECGINVPGIIRKEDGDFVTYPHLHTLELTGDPEYDAMLHPVFPGVVAFPSLRRLKIDYEYSFGDDVVFRGNAATLESLHLYLGNRAIDVLRKYGVFTANSHPKLRYVRLWYGMDCVLSMFDVPTDAVQFAMGIGRAAPMRDIGGFSGDQEEIPSLLRLNGLDSIQVLSLDETYLNTWEVIELIKALPMMSDLYLMPVSLGPLPDGVTLDELPEFAISTHAPMGKRFRCCHLRYPTTRGYTKVKWVLLLALTCPNFTFVSTPPTMRKEFIKQLKAEIDTDMFKPYASRFQCFIS